MCGIIAGISGRDIALVLIEGLKRLEYRGYDSAGLAVINAKGECELVRICGKVNALLQSYQKLPILGKVGVAHTRWATHGRPSEQNAHPHMFDKRVALVHNGIIENHLTLQQQLTQQCVAFASETDSEVIVQWIGKALETTQDLLEAVQQTIKKLQGAYAFAVIAQNFPDRIVVAREGSPLVIGVGVGEHFVASDVLALLPLTQKMVVLEDGDVAEIYLDRYVIYDKTGRPVERKVKEVSLCMHDLGRGEYRHYMQKEIFEQPDAIRSALASRVNGKYLVDAIFGIQAKTLFDKTKAIHIVACGTSYHAGLVAKYWFEQIAGLACHVEVASEMRYRDVVVVPGTLLVALSQSGETADTLAAIKALRGKAYCGVLGICNVPESSLVRVSDLAFLTQAGPEVGVASTKAFTTQLVSLLMLVQCFEQRAKRTEGTEIVEVLRALPQLIEHLLELDARIAKLACRFDDKAHALFIGRGVHYPIAKEGALKLKEISYIHAEAYPAGELKHGPLALVDRHMPVVALVPNDALLDKLKSNLQEIRARQGELIVFAEKGTGLTEGEGMAVVEIPAVGALSAPIAFTVLLQLLAYHVAVRKGTDVDQPRNLAKSVTVE